MAVLNGKRHTFEEFSSIKAENLHFDHILELVDVI